MINGAEDETNVVVAVRLQSATDCTCLQLCLQSDCVNKSGLTFSIESSVESGSNLESAFTKSPAAISLNGKLITQINYFTN